jgi:hypothetical protein
MTTEMTGDRCPEHPDAEHDDDEGCLHGWTATERGCPWRPAPKTVEPVGVFDRIAVAMAASGATGLRFRRSAGSSDRRWRRNR